MTHLSEREHVARKRHQCTSCLGAIEPGTRYGRWCGLSDGQFASLPYHLECRAWEIQLHRDNDLHADEWRSLHEWVDEDREGSLDGAPDVVRERFATQGEAVTR